MKKISKLFAVLLTLILIGSTLTACGGGKKTKETANEDESTKTEENKDESSNGQSANNDEKVDEIYYLNFKQKSQKCITRLLLIMRQRPELRLKL